MFVFFIFVKKSLIKSCSSSKDLSEYKSSWSYVERYKFCIHLRSLNVRHFGILAATALTMMASRSPSMAWPPPPLTFIQIYKLVYKYIVGETLTESAVVSLAYMYLC
jgi:hypothetical protein